MIVTGFMGSPRKGGNTAFLLKQFLDNARRYGAQTHDVHVPSLEIHPCTGCALCERKGFCHFDDDMQKIVFPLLRRSDVVVMASPVYFYNFPAEMKALIDRSQTLWARRYKLGLTDVGLSSRRGLLLSVGATRGKDLFDGMHLTMKYFFRGISTEFSGELTYHRIEDIGDLKKHPQVMGDVARTADRLLPSLKNRVTLLFVCPDNSLAGPMAQALTRHHGGEKICALSAGIKPAPCVNPELERSLERASLDVWGEQPESVSSVTASVTPDRVILLGIQNDPSLQIPEVPVTTWDIPVHRSLTPEDVDRLRDDIETRVKTLIDEVHEANH